METDGKRAIARAGRVRISLVVLLSLSTGLAACSSYRAASYPAVGDAAGRRDADRALPTVATGDHVKVALRDGSTFKGRVLGASPSVLTLTHGDHVRAEQEAPVSIDVNMIESIEKRQGNAGKTFGLVVLVVGGLVGALAIAVAAGGGVGANFGG